MLLKKVYLKMIAEKFHSPTLLEWRILLAIRLKAQPKLMAAQFLTQQIFRQPTAFSKTIARKQAKEQAAEQLPMRAHMRRLTKIILIIALPQQPLPMAARL